MGTQILTGSGRYLDFAAPTPEMIDAGDIARGLARQGRFAGQTRRFYSVAEHSVNCAELARQRGMSTELTLICLLHDAAEAYTGDIVTPLKRMLPGLMDVEIAIMCAVWRRYRLPMPDANTACLLHEIDQTMLATEADQMVQLPPGETKWWGAPIRAQNPDRPWPFGYYSPADAERAWLGWFRELYTDDWQLRVGSKQP